MPRIIAVTDEELDTDARIHITKSPDTGESQIVKLELATLSGRGIRSRDLLIFQELGLHLPDPDSILPTVQTSPPPQVEAPQVQETVAEEPKKKITHKKDKPKLKYSVGPAGRTYYERPSVQELMRVYAEAGYSPLGVANYYGIKPEVVSTWIGRLRKAGHDFPRSGHAPTSPPAPQ